MTSLISTFIVKTLCDHQGCLDYRRLEEKLTQSYTVAESILRSVLDDDSKIAIQEGSQKAVGNQMISPDSLIVAKTGLRLCQKKPGECLQCEGLHLCRYFVCGECMFGHKCKNPHSVTAELLKKYDLQNLSEKQLFQLLLQNDPYLLPEICQHYNKGTCKFTTSCTKLHVCQHHFQGDCKFGSTCKRAHNVDAQGVKLFRGFSQENIRNLHKIYRNKFIILGQQERPAALVVPEVSAPKQQPSHSNPGSTISDAERNEICLHFIHRRCIFRDKCARVHWHLPYRWQALDSDGVTWKDLPDMENIEKAYCDPQHDTYSMDQLPPNSGQSVGQSVDFMKMTYRASQVRRLSTASSMSVKLSRLILTTEWLWYWKDKGGNWEEFGKGDGDTLASVTSKTVENMYLANRDTEMPFSAGNHQCILHFKGAHGPEQMYQENIKTKSQKAVRRRPRFVSAQDVELKLKSSASSHSSSSPTAAQSL